MRRRLGIVLSAVLLAVALGVIGATLPVPFVALGPGPTYDTRGDYEGEPIVTIEGQPTYPTSGRLNMTTVSVTTEIPLFTALGYWASGQRRMVPREALYPSDRTPEQVQEQNAAQFASSESNAEAAAVAELGLPARVLVAGVVAGSPADGVLRAGDEIVEVAGQPVDAAGQVAERIATTAPGDAVTVAFRRDGGEHRAEVVLGVHPDPLRLQGFLGVTPTAELRDGDVRFDLGGIGGPSAGLMFALAVVDELTPGALTGGRFVAGTGAIDAGGVVSAIDGVPFKMAKAREVGAEVFLVPAANCAEAVQTVPHGLQLVSVETLGSAIAALDALTAGRPVPTCAAD